MNKKERLTSKLVETYNRFKLKQIFNLDSKEKNLKVQFKNELDEFYKFSNMKEKLKQEEEIHDKVYNSLIKILKSRGILVNIPNKNFQVKEWDNLFIKDINSLYSLISKNGDLIYAFEKKYNESIKHIVNECSYSVIVIRKNENSIKVQLRILEKCVD